ncbi:MAG: SMC family ATPase [Chloroflexi bacterium]|nr:SMC family ATPase [Chloroflexota bacterium]
MIPIRLKMRNFMCYREAELPFGGIHLGCLSGDNGSGKSTVIDAVTWALWGEARARGDDDLIRSGHNEMEVEFDFSVNRQAYRVIRKHARPRRQNTSGQTWLELQVASGDGFKPISGNQLRQTQQKIVDILHMDYATFINSAFLRQGHADEFTNQQPARRKEVLASILELSVYDQLEARAKELARLQEDARNALESAIREIARELARKPEYEAELVKAQSALSLAEDAVKEGETALEGLRRRKEGLEKKKARLEQIEAHMTATTADIARWQSQARQHRDSVVEYEELLGRRAEIDSGYARFTRTRQLCEELDGKLRRSASLEKQKSQLETRINQAGQQLVTGHTLVQRKIDDLQARAAKVPGIREQLQQVRGRLERLAGEEADLQQKRLASQELKSAIARLEAEESRLTGEIQDIAEKLEMLSHQEEARCPLCDTELAGDGLGLIRSRYAADRQARERSLETARQDLVRGRTGLQAATAEIARLESGLGKEKAAAQGRLGALEKELGECEEAGRELGGEKDSLQAIEERMGRRDYALPEQEALREILGELARLAYDPERHEEARQQLKDLETFDQAHQRLGEADRLIIREKEALAGAEKALQELRLSLEADRQQQSSLATEVKALPELLNDLDRAEAAHRRLVAQRGQALEVVGAVKGSLQRCDELEARKKEKEALLSRAAREEDIYRQLGRAFGKGGIQAMLIETALPEIEAEATGLLGRMTNNRMHVKFEPQRETRKGTVVETLDIKISDELGTRNYEMFSGGEAFRIDFAIRIALSRLLARRAGAPLPTLIIDEGFGTQDSTGIEKIKEAISSIQDDFEKVIVITHIDELRNAFPVRIDVVKTPDGSVLEINA